MKVKKLNFISNSLLIIMIIATFISIIEALNNSDSALKTNNSPTFISGAESTYLQGKFSNAQKNKHTVVLDAGHGGKDPGSIGPKGTLEKDVVLAITLKAGRILEKKGFNVIYTRKNDNVSWTSKKAELLSRAEVSNKNNSDIFVSVHVNSSKYENVGGIETYYHEASSQGQRLARIIQSKIVKEVKLRDRGTKYQDFSILRNVDVPTVIIELAYISNVKEETLLRSSEYQDKYAQAIANGIVEYFK